jgi:hypothetical protein
LRQFILQVFGLQVGRLVEEITGAQQQAGKRTSAEE